MKTMRTILVLAVAALSSILLSAQSYQRVITRDGSQYEGQWPKGRGVLYSYNEGLVFGQFEKGKPHGKCVCYKLNGEVYWGDYKKGKPTGNGRIYRDNGIVIAGDYKNGKYHGVDTLYRSNGSVLVAKFKKGKLVNRVMDTKDAKAVGIAGKPRYPQIDLRRKHEDFLKELELAWEERNDILRQSTGFIHPKFQGGGVDDFAIWVNSQVVYPSDMRPGQNSRTVLVEFTVKEDGSVADVHAIFGSDKSLNEAAEHAVKKSPKWEPGEQQGQKRSVRLTIPVVFGM